MTNAERCPSRHESKRRCTLRRGHAFDHTVCVPTADGVDEVSWSTDPPKNEAAQALGRLGGSANTKAQNLARKRNARHAGRPRRVCVTCLQPVAVTGRHVDRSLDSTCDGQRPGAWRWQKRSER